MVSLFSPLIRTSTQPIHLDRSIFFCVNNISVYFMHLYRNANEKRVRQSLALFLYLLMTSNVHGNGFVENRFFHFITVRSAFLYFWMALGGLSHTTLKRETLNRKNRWSFHWLHNTTKQLYSSLLYTQAFDCDRNIEEERTFEKPVLKGFCFCMWVYFI